MAEPTQEQLADLARVSHLSRVVLEPGDRWEWWENGGRAGPDGWDGYWILQRVPAGGTGEDGRRAGHWTSWDGIGLTERANHDPLEAFLIVLAYAKRVRKHAYLEHALRPEA